MRRRYAEAAEAVTPILLPLAVLPASFAAHRQDDVQAKTFLQDDERSGLCSRLNDCVWGDRLVQVSFGRDERMFCDFIVC
jgi:hypothetical protein